MMGRFTLRSRRFAQKSPWLMALIWLSLFTPAQSLAQPAEGQEAPPPAVGAGVGEDAAKPAAGAGEDVAKPAAGEGEVPPPAAGAAEAAAGAGEDAAKAAEADVERAAQALAQAGLPPFLARMQRQPVKVKITLGEQADAPALPAQTPVGLRILASGALVKEYTARVGADGFAHFEGIPTNPEVQGSIAYAFWVDHQGVRFPFLLETLPPEDGQVWLPVQPVTASLDALRAEHALIEFFPDEDALVVRHHLRLFNHGQAAVDLGRLPGGGLKLPCPQGAKHPSLQEENSPLAEVRGTDLWFTGALLAGGVPAEFTLIYSIPYAEETLEFQQTLPITSNLGVAVTSLDRQPNQRKAFPLKLHSRGAMGEVRQQQDNQGQNFDVLRAEGVRLAPNESLRFAVSGLPIERNLAFWVMGLLSLVAALWVLLGFKRSPQATARLSRAHLTAERDRLVRTLGRMRKAHERGKMPTVRFEREQEAITARLVSLYRALDRLDHRS